LPTGNFDVAESESGDVRKCLMKIDKINKQVASGEMKATQAKSALEVLEKSFLMIRGIPIQQASKECLNPIDRLEDTDILEMGEEALGKLEAAIAGISGLAIQKKNRWLKLIARIRAVQIEARKSAMAFWIYVGRTSEKNEIFDMAPVHYGYFDVWKDDNSNSLIMAPPGHGKTTSLRGQVLYTVCKNPDRRILICYDTDDKAQKEVVLLKNYLNSGRLRALYPEIWVLDRNDGAQNSSKRFTVNRPNIGSREPTIECAGIMSKVNGNGYDEIVIDDPCPETVAYQPSSRMAINVKFNTVIEERLRDPANSRIRMICTPWHADDLAGMIQKDVREGRRAGWHIEVDRFAIKEDDDGEPVSIWPQRYKPHHYTAKKLKLNRNQYARLYELKCLADEERLVNTFHYFPYDEDDRGWEKLSEPQAARYKEVLDGIKNGEMWLSIDPSATAGKISSKTAVTKFSITAKGYIFVLDAWEFPGNPVEMQDWLVEQVVLGKVHRILVEAQGGMKACAVLWEEYIWKQLQARKIKWAGSIIQVQTQGKGGGQNIGKARRLQNTAAYIERGFVRFPGRIRFLKNGSVDFACSKSERIIKLIDQIYNFPSGTNDGVDTVTQMLIYNEDRLPQVSDVATQNGTEQFIDPIKAACKKQLSEALRPQTSASDGEQKWCNTLLGQVA